MLSREQVRDAIAADRESACAVTDGRDYLRLTKFFSVEDVSIFGFELKDGAEPRPPLEWSRVSILRQLGDDLEFAFEKAEGQRGISASLMYEVIKMWMWVLEDGLQHHSAYDDYGLPFLREVHDKYQAEIAKVIQQDTAEDSPAGKDTDSTDDSRQ